MTEQPGNSGQVSQDRTQKPVQSMTAESEQLGQIGQNSRGRTTGTGKSGQDIRDRTEKKQDTETRQLRQDS